MRNLFNWAVFFPQVTPDDVLTPQVFQLALQAHAFPWASISLLTMSWQVSMFLYPPLMIPGGVLVLLLGSILMGSRNCSDADCIAHQHTGEFKPNNQLTRES